MYLISSVALLAFLVQGATCQTVKQCTTDNACECLDIQATEVQCTGKESCFGAYIDIANNGRVVCSGISSCSSSYLAADGAVAHVDCRAQGSCNSAEIEVVSKVTCGNTPFGACKSTTISYPDAVYCHGGNGSNGAQCDGVKVNSPDGFVVCGSRHACRGVSIVEDDGCGGESLVATVPDNQLYIWTALSGSMKATHMLDYLNTMHSAGPSTCEDANNDGVCDILPYWCSLTKQPNVATCPSRFTHNSATKSWALAAAAMEDPSSASNGDDGNDDAGLENWITGVIVIVGFIALMLMAVLYLGQKNGWSWWKQLCGQKQQGEEEPKDEATTSKEEESRETAKGVQDDSSTKGSGTGKDDPGMPVQDV